MTTTINNYQQLHCGIVWSLTSSRILDFKQLSQIWREGCGGSGGREEKIHIPAINHRQKCSKTLYIWGIDVRCNCNLKGYIALASHNVVVSFALLHHIGAYGYGTRMGGSLSSTNTPTLRISSNTFLCTASDDGQMRLQHTTHTNTKRHHHGGRAANPSSGVDLMNPHHPRIWRPVTYFFQGHRCEVLIHTLNQCSRYNQFILALYVVKIRRVCRRQWWPKLHPLLLMDTHTDGCP